MDAKEINQLNSIVSEVRRLTSLTTVFQDKLEKACNTTDIDIVEDYAIGTDLYDILAGNGTANEFLKAENKEFCSAR